MNARRRLLLGARVFIGCRWNFDWPHANSVLVFPEGLGAVVGVPRVTEVSEPLLVLLKVLFLSSVLSLLEGFKGLLHSRRPAAPRARSAHT